jgi:hypothetical protein
MFLFHAIFLVVFLTIINFFHTYIIKMGNAVKSFAKFVAKSTISAAGALVPVVGGPIASYINSKFAKGSYDIGTPGVEIPEDRKIKPINTPAQLVSLVKQFPDEAKKAGLTVDMIKEEVKEAKEQAKAVGGLIAFKGKEPKATSVVAAAFPPIKDQVIATRAKGGDVPQKPKKPRSEAQKAAIAKLVAMNKKRRDKQ